jgi:hypothetical protein
VDDIALFVIHRADYRRYYGIQMGEGNIAFAYRSSSTQSSFPPLMPA